MKFSEQQALILERLIEAIETDDAMPARIGPKKFGSAMPDYFQNDKEVWILEFEDLREKMRFRTRQRRDERHRQAERRAKCSTARITRMEEALDWVLKWIWDQDVRTCLLAYVTVRARNQDWSRFLSARNRRHSQKKAWVRQSTYRWISKSIQMIEQQLSKNDLFLQEDGSCVLRHEQAERAGKSGTVGFACADAA